MGSINSSTRHRMSGSLDLSSSQQEGLATQGETDRAQQDQSEDVGPGDALSLRDNDADDSGAETNDLSSILAYLIRRYI